MLIARFTRPDEAPALISLYRSAPPEDQAHLYMPDGFDAAVEKRCAEKRLIVFSEPDNGTNIYAACHIGSGRTDAGEPMVGMGGALKSAAGKADARPEYRPIFPHMIALSIAEMVARDLITISDDGKIEPIISIGTFAENNKAKLQLLGLGFEPYFTGSFPRDGKTQVYTDFKPSSPSVVNAALQAFINHMYGDQKIITPSDEFACMQKEGRQKILSVMEKLSSTGFAAAPAKLPLWKLAP